MKKKPPHRCRCVKNKTLSLSDRGSWMQLEGWPARLTRAKCEMKNGTVQNGEEGSKNAVSVETSTERKQSSGNQGEK